MKQLKELLKARALTFDELGLLYSYKYGVNVNTSLQSVGRDMKLGEFLGLHSDFCVREGKVSVAGQPAAAPPGLALGARPPSTRADLARSQSPEGTPKKKVLARSREPPLAAGTARRPLPQR